MTAPASGRKAADRARLPAAEPAAPTAAARTTPPADRAARRPQPTPRTPVVLAALRTREGAIATLALLAIAAHLILRFATPALGATVAAGPFPWQDLPLLAALLLGGLPLVVDLGRKLVHLEFSSDLLAGISIVTSVVLDQYLAGTLVVLMLSGGAALEHFAVRNASAVLSALARRAPTQAHRREQGTLTDVPLDAVAVGDELVVFPHEVCPVDGTVREGHGTMDESYLTGEPYVMAKVPGATVLSGALNGEVALTIRADRRAVDSRYAKIMQVMRESEQRRPRIRRLGDQLGAVYTPVAVAIAVVAWVASGDPLRFLAVLVVATPCPLLIAIPVGIIGSISLAARRGIIIKDPAVLERIETCRTAMFDKTGTLTYGEPKLTAIVPPSDATSTAGAGAPSGVWRLDAVGVLPLLASLERYSRHPLASAILDAAAAAGVPLEEPSEVSERPGEGLRGTVRGHRVQVTSRRQALAQDPALETLLPPFAGGMECIVLVDGAYAATCQFRDEPRTDGVHFIGHLGPLHHIERVLLISGDRESEVRYLADKVGIREVYASQTPEQKLALVRAETARAPTLFLGDGINDAPALTAATVGIAFGQGSDITTEAAGAVILDSSLQRVDELLHIGRRMRAIILQSAVGGMAVSVVGMLFAAFGWLPPVAGALTQEIIDVFAVANALRVAVPPKTLSDF